MKTLHIYRSEPVSWVRSLRSELQEDGPESEVRLYETPVDYDRLLEKIFEHDRAICWW